jgi:hypothetical protein
MPAGQRGRGADGGNETQTTFVDMTSGAGHGVGVRIGEPARKHGVADDLTMLIGPARDGAPLELGVLDLTGEDLVIVHAMRLHPKFYPFLQQG